MYTNTITYKLIYWLYWKHFGKAMGQGTSDGNLCEIANRFPARPTVNSHIKMEIFTLHRTVAIERHKTFLPDYSLCCGCVAWSHVLSLNEFAWSISNACSNMDTSFIWCLMQYTKPAVVFYWCRINGCIELYLTNWSLILH